MYRTVWRQFQLELPDDWELLQFTRSSETGRCAFADRWRFRFEFNWREVKGMPDFERMLGDYRGKLEEEGYTELVLAQHHDWNGVVGKRGPLTVARFGGYFTHAKVLLELVFLWPDERDSGLERRVLESVAFIPSDAGLSTWQCFGMEFGVAADLPLHAVAANPAHHQLAFRSKNRRREQQFGRRGMVSEWLRIGVEQWLQRSLPRDMTVNESRTRRLAGHDIAVVRGTATSPKLKDLLFGRRDVKGAAWICPRDGRLYSLVRFSTSRESASAAPPWLRCCSDVEVAL